MKVQTHPDSAVEQWGIDRGAEVLAKIYDEAVNIAVWQRELDVGIGQYLTELLSRPEGIAVKLSGTPEQLMAEIQQVFPAELYCPSGESLSASTFYCDLRLVIEMFTCLFDAKILGLRINVLEHAMCPRFHTDNVGVRLITTYHGLGTEWLPDGVINRRALGSTFASQVGVPGAITDHEQFIEQMGTGDVALLKGELWEGNEGRGVVPRSPALTVKQPKRLVMTCDLIE